MLGAIGVTRMSHQVHSPLQQRVFVVIDETMRGSQLVDLCEVGEGEGHDNGSERALSSTDGVASIDRDFDVAGRGGDDGCVRTTGWVDIT